MAAGPVSLLSRVASDTYYFRKMEVAHHDVFLWMAIPCRWLEQLSVTSVVPGGLAVCVLETVDALSQDLAFDSSRWWSEHRPGPLKREQVTLRCFSEV